jgi:hypothetical protein
MDSTYQSIFRRLCTTKKIDEFKFPVSRPDDVSSHPDAYLSTVPSVRTTCHTVRTTCSFRPNSPLYREASTRLAFVRMFQQHIRMPLSTRTASDSFQAPRKGRSINRPDDVVSRPDACPLKARITIQISLSGRQSVLVWMRVQLIWKLSIRLQPFGRLPLMVRTLG